MKPLNLDNKPCSPISSNCVVWQGPDIPCIKLCIGDTVSDVVFAMATELCTILDTLKVTNYDLTCFNLQACGPQDFQALIQFLITQICELQGVTVAPTKEQTCPDCVVSVADCFVTGTQTTMQLVDYVQLIGERVCSIITEISLINTQITDILIRVTTLENAPVPTFTIPSFTITCQIGSLLSGTTQPIDTLLQEFINNVWCGFFTVTGSTTDLTNAVDANCITDASISLTKSPATMGAGYAGTWVPDVSYSSVADAINNIWISLCDIFNYLTVNDFTITVADTQTIDLELSVGNELTAKIQDTGWIDLEGFDFYNTLDKPKCRRIGNIIYFKGAASVPLDNLGVAYSIDSLYDLRAVTTVLPFTGTPSGVQNLGDILVWNNGNSCIPTGILNGDVIDDVYRLDAPTIAERPIQIGTSATRLFGATRIQIKADGTLIIATLDSYESMPPTLLPAPALTTLQGSSSLRYITSNVRLNDLVPDFTAVPSDVHSFPLPDPWDVAANYTVGDIVEEGGSFYQAFVNVTGGGAPSVTDTVWDPYTSKVDTANQGISVKYPLSCNAGKATELGGFFVILDGLTAFVTEP